MSQKGELNAHAKLSDADVIAIRAAVADGSATQAEMARRHKVSKATIWDVVRGNLWTHVSSPEVRP